MTSRAGKTGLKFWIVIAAILALGLRSSHAQDFSRVINAVGGVFNKLGITDLYKFAKTRDTTFYMSPPGTYDICLIMNLAGSSLSTWGSEEVKNSKFRSHIDSESMVNTTVTVGYEGIAIGYTFNPFSKNKDSKDSRFSLTLHGNFLGLDLAYHNIKSFSGYSRMGDVRHVIPYGDPNMKLFILNTYIVFNHKHYSFPAGINQSYIQKRSSGSLIGGITYTNNRTNVNSVGFGEPSLKINSRLISIGAGYGYNYVPRKNVLFAVAFMPKFVVYDSSYLGVDHYDIQQTFKRPQLTYSASLALVRWYGKLYLGFSALTDGYTSHKSGSGYNIIQNQWQLHTHIGFNF